MELKPSRRAVLNLLMANCKQSDRSIAKSANVSQPTVTRIRQKLEENGIIKGYIAIPDYAKIGYKIGAVITGQFPIISDESIVVNASTISEDTDVMLITFHKTIEDYNAFLDKIKAKKREGSKLTASLFTTHTLEVKSLKVPQKGA